MFPFTHKIIDDLRSLILYTFKCNSCNAVYHGKTKRHFRVRANEHLGISCLSGKPFKYDGPNATAIREHCHVHSHGNGITDFKIVGSAKNDYFLRIKESLMLYKSDNTINRAGTSIPLLLFN